MEFYRLPSVSTTIFPYSFASLATPEMDPLRLTFFFFFFQSICSQKQFSKSCPMKKVFSATKSMQFCFAASVFDFISNGFFLGHLIVH